jgi:chemotaxis methyl-accepting protein methylase
MRAANLLNRAYFSEQTLSQMLSTLKERLMPGGFLIVCRTDLAGTNNAGIFRLIGSHFSLCGKLGSGCEIEDIITAI